MSQAIKEFVRGMGQALDLGATLSPAREERQCSSAEALASHWNRVGNYVRGAYETVEKEKRESSSGQS